MKHFPIFVATDNQRIVVSGGGEAAVAKLRLLLKTTAQIHVIADTVTSEIDDWSRAGKLTVIQRAMQAGDARDARLFYAANDDDGEDARVTALAQADGALTNWVDNLGQSQFITPAIVDRDPVTIAIGTEGAAPVVARAIKRDLEDKLPTRLGALARIGKSFRAMADVLPMGRIRRDFWSDYYFGTGPAAYDANGADGARAALDNLLHLYSTRSAKQGHVDFVGAGPGDPDLLTMKARHALHEADVVIYDHAISPEVLELARREAQLIAVSADALNIQSLRHAKSGAQVVRLTPGDGSDLRVEMDIVQGQGLSNTLIPGVSQGNAPKFAPWANQSTQKQAALQ